MTDPRVDSCNHQKLSEDSGKIRCMHPKREYFHCKANRQEGTCPFGYDTTYDDPEVRPVRKFTSSIENRIKHFQEGHITTRWNLKNRLDAYLLYYQLDTLQFRCFELAIALQREGRYKDSHRAWAKHDAYNIVMHDLFPYKDGSGKTLSDDYQKVQREITELEEKRGDS